MEKSKVTPEFKPVDQQNIIIVDECSVEENIVTENIVTENIVNENIITENIIIENPITENPIEILPNNSDIEEFRKIIDNLKNELEKLKVNLDEKEYNIKELVAENKRISKLNLLLKLKQDLDNNSFEINSKIEVERENIKNEENNKVLDETVKKVVSSENKTAPKRNILYF